MKCNEFHHIWESEIMIYDLFNFFFYKKKALSNYELSDNYTLGITTKDL